MLPLDEFFVKKLKMLQHCITKWHKVQFHKKNLFKLLQSKYLIQTVEFSIQYYVTLLQWNNNFTMIIIIINFSNQIVQSIKLQPNHTLMHTLLSHFQLFFWYQFAHYTHITHTHFDYFRSIAFHFNICYWINQLTSSFYFQFHNGIFAKSAWSFNKHALNIHVLYIVRQTEKRMCITNSETWWLTFFVCFFSSSSL